MTCAACSARVEKVSKATPGVQKAEVNLLKGTMVLEADSDAVVQQVIRNIKAAGYDAFSPDSSKKTEAGDTLKVEILEIALGAYAVMSETPLSSAGERDGF